MENEIIYLIVEESKIGFKSSFYPKCAFKTFIEAQIFCKKEKSKEYKIMPIGLV